MSWELHQVLRPPRQTSGLPCPDLQYLPLFDEAGLDNYFCVVKEGGTEWTECLTQREGIVEDNGGEKKKKKTNKKKKDQKRAFCFSCLTGSKEDKEQLGPGYPVLSGN